MTKFPCVACHNSGEEESSTNRKSYFFIYCLKDEIQWLIRIHCVKKIYFWYVYYSVRQNKVLILMNRHEEIIRKYKKLLHDIFTTEFYQWLREHYLPKIIKFDRDEEGKIKKNKDTGFYTGKVGIAQGLPNKEVMIYAFSLLRQFLLNRDDVSIYKIGRHIKKIGTEDNYNKYDYWFKKFKKYSDGISGATYRRTDKQGNEIIKNYSRLELVKEFFYGDIFHRDDDKFDVSKNPLSMNKIVEYFLGFLMFICRIANVVQFPEEDYSLYQKNCPERIYYGS